MKLILFLLLIALPALIVSAQTQSEMNQEAYDDYKKSDIELNVTYKKILTMYKSDTAFIKRLRVSQRLWVKFRDAELEMKYPPREPGYYGSVQPMCNAYYLKELTEERTKKLQLWLN